MLPVGFTVAAMHLEKLPMAFFIEAPATAKTI